MLRPCSIFRGVSGIFRKVDADKGLSVSICKVLAVSIVALVAACATPQKQEQVSQVRGETLVAGVGDVVLRIERTSDLPNAFGGADIFGRKKAQGATEVRFLGISDGHVVLARNDIDIDSDETTMTRGGGLLLPSQTTTSIAGVVGTTPVTGVATTGGYTYIPLRNAETRVRETGWITVTIRAEPGSKAVLAGQVIEIMEAEPGLLRYRLEPSGV